MRIIFLLALIFMNGAGIFSLGAEAAGILELKGAWEYRWGESPDTLKGPAWADPATDPSGWNKAATPYNPEGRKRQNVLWVRTRLPLAVFNDPVLHVRGIDQAFEVFLDKTPIYRFGDIRQKLSGFSWHAIPLPQGYQGRTVTFRIRSTLNTIGFTSGRVVLGPLPVIQNDIMKKDIDKLILGIMFITIGMTAVFLFFSKVNQKAFLAFGLFNILLGVYTVAQTEMKQLVFGSGPAAWGTVELLSLYLIPAFANSLAKEILKVKRKSVINAVWLASVLFAAAAAFASVVNPNLLMTILPGFKIGLLANIAAVFLYSLIASFRGNIDARVFTVGFSILSLFAVNDILQEIRLIPKSFYITHWGLFLFIMTLAYILISKIVIMYNQLKGYSEELEEKNIIVSRTINELEKLYEEIEYTQKEVILRLSEITEARSKETGNHVRRVAEYSRILALAYGLPESEVDIIKLAAPMHDIGKLAIPDSILMKPDKLTHEEFEVIKTHTITGYEMLNKSKRDIFSAAAIIAYEHHEKWDGDGYPRRLKGGDIHIYGRITAVADVFDSLASDRCYKKAWDLDKVLQFMNENRKKHFDPDLVNMLFENIDVFITIKNRYKDEYSGE